MQTQQHYPRVNKKSIPIGYLPRGKCKDILLEMDKYERRRLRLLDLRDSQCRGSAANLARKIERDQTYVTRMLYPEGKKGKKRIADDMMEIIETAFDLPRGWMDQHAGADALHAYAGNKVWVIGNGQGGLPDRIWSDGDHPVGASDKYADVATDDSHAFVVCVRGDSMIPRYQPGEYALVEPDTPPEIEDDVLVRLASGETMLKRLLSRRAGIRLGSYNSSEVLTYAQDEITWMYYVSHPIPARKIKHWVKQQEYEGEERRREEEPRNPERRSGYKLPEPKTEIEHVYGKAESNKSKEQQ